MKVKTIEKVQDASKMKVDMLIGTLLTFEMAINDKLEKKSKSVAFNIDGEKCDDQVEGGTDENLIESMSLLYKISRKAMRIIERKPRSNITTNVKDNQQQNSKAANFQRKGKDREK